MSDANATQVGGNHYRTNFQHWDLIEGLRLPYFPSQITRYVARWRKKNGIEDLEKALHYMDKMIEIEQQRKRDQTHLMDLFIMANNLQEHERIVFNMLINFQLGDEDRLTEARNNIVELIAIIKGEKHPSGHPIDPVFREPRDEWRS